MFTGIVDHCGKIIKLKKTAETIHLWIEANFSDLVLGESIAVNGICLTVTEINDKSFACDISPETFRLTTAANFSISQKVNLERALQLSSRLGGHMVSGHVDQTAVVEHIEQNQAFTRMVFAGVSELNMPLVIKKGSVAVNGVSLTINEVFPTGFSVMLIPHTLACTNLAELNKSAEVNLEFDLVARIIVDQYQRYSTTH